MSGAAIAQIESGRRKDIRLSSLSALADAMNVGIDYLIGTTTPKLLQHRVLPYGSDEEFLATAVPFLAEGIERADAVLAVTTEAQIGRLRDLLGGTDGVEFADSADWYRSPNDALDRYRSFVVKKNEAGATWTRIVGEPVWEGRSDAESAAWTRYESVLNLAFASLPATIVCPYDTRSLPASVIDDARRTHPEIVQGGEATASPTYRDPEDILIDPSTTFG